MVFILNSFCLGDPNRPSSQMLKFKLLQFDNASKWMAGENSNYSWVNQNDAWFGSGIKEFLQIKLQEIWAYSQKSQNKQDNTLNRPYQVRNQVPVASLITRDIYSTLKSRVRYMFGKTKSCNIKVWQRCGINRVFLKSMIQINRFRKQFDVS